MLREVLTLLRQRKKQSKSILDASTVLRSYVQIKHPELIDELNSWILKRRNIYASVFTQYFNEALCCLEGEVFDKRRIQISVLSGSLGKILDTLLDDKIVEPRYVQIFGEKLSSGIEIPSLSLAYALEDRLRTYLPNDFCQSFSETIQRYNNVQEDCLELQDKGLKDTRLLQLKDRAGGYSALLLYALMFPEVKDVSTKITEGYAPKGSLPTTKFDAVFNLGAWIQRIDDMWDVDDDINRSVKNLATSGIVDWKIIAEEKQYVFDGLRKHYQGKAVKSVEEEFNPLTNRFLRRYF